MSDEPRRWTVYGFDSDVLLNGAPATRTHYEAYQGSPNAGDEEGVEVMPVSEHRELVDRAREVVKQFHDTGDYTRVSSELGGAIIRLRDAAK